MIALANVSFAYDRGAPLLEDVSLTFGPGFTLVLGPNGSGKSTLLKIAAGVERPDAGTVSLEGHDAWRDEVAARRGLAYVPEHPDLSPYASVRETLELVCRLRAVPSSEVRTALAAVGLDTLGGRSVRELSMGQRRRAVLAAAMIGQPRIAILDEPLEAMDRGARAMLVQWFRTLVAEGAAVIVATHNVEPVVELATAVVAVNAGVPRVIQSLPAAHAERLALVDGLARGEGAPA